MDDYFSYSDEELRCEYLNNTIFNKDESDCSESSDENDDIEEYIPLESSLTTLIKIKKRGTYIFISYLTDSKQTQTYGTIQTDKKHHVNIDYKCDEGDMKIINDMLTSDVTTGFILITSLNSEINTNSVSELLRSSYELGTSLQCGKYYINKRDIRKSFDKHLSRGLGILTTSNRLANHLIKNNVSKIKFSRTVIPAYVIAKIYNQLIHKLTINYSSIKDCILEE